MIDQIKHYEISFTFYPTQGHIREAILEHAERNNVIPNLHNYVTFSHVNSPTVMFEYFVRYYGKQKNLDDILREQIEYLISNLEK